MISALKNMVKANHLNQALTWKQACKLACEEYFDVITERTVMLWYRELHMR